MTAQPYVEVVYDKTDDLSGGRGIVGPQKSLADAEAIVAEFTVQHADKQFAARVVWIDLEDTNG
jgi:hypothetical protein